MISKGIRITVLVQALQILPLLSAQQCTKSGDSQYGYALQLSSYKTTIEESLGTCYNKCFYDKDCCSINYKIADDRCEHNHVTKLGFPSRFVRQHGSVYAETRDPDHGSSKINPAPSCKKILELNKKASSGIYWIQIDHGVTQTSPFQVYCDMETDGGGWTLVYSYHFLNFANFGSSSNGVNPIPNWPVNPTYTTPDKISTTVPLSETSYSAMNFSLWKEIGNEFLIKPNITHWVSCRPGIGDLVNWKQGSISCKVVKNVATVCLDKAPTMLHIFNCGVALYANDHFFYFEASTTHCYPVHDSCGTRSTSNYLTYISPPGGAMYVR